MAFVNTLKQTNFCPNNNDVNFIPIVLVYFKSAISVKWMEYEFEIPCLRIASKLLAVIKMYHLKGNKHCILFVYCDAHH